MRLPHVQVVQAKGRDYLYYRRDGKRLPLPGPEGSPEFNAEYKRLHAMHEQGPVQHTVAEAITGYLGSADFSALSPISQANYRYYLDQMRGNLGTLPLATLDATWVDAFRDALKDRPNYYNATLSRMRSVVARYRKLHPSLMPENPWADAKPLPTAESDQNKPWPDDVLQAVRRHATPEFRALIDTLLLTGQRISDVCRLETHQWQRSDGLLQIHQGKTHKNVLLHVPPALHDVFASMAGRHPVKLLVSPRRQPWTPGNAQETLARALDTLGIPRYTLHGLRATGPTALKMLGMENRAIRELTGHDSDQNLEVYLRGVNGHALARQAGEELARRFEQVLVKDKGESNTRRFSGLTGRAAANALFARQETAAGKPLANCKTPPAEAE